MPVDRDLGLPECKRVSVPISRAVMIARDFRIATIGS